MIEIGKLAQELGVDESTLLTSITQMGIELRQRGKALINKDADAIRTALASKKEEVQETNADKGTIAIPVVISLKDLAERLHSTPSEVLKVLLQNGVQANINAELDFETAAIIASELGYGAVEEKEDLIQGLEDALDPENLLSEILAEKDKKNLVARPPVVTIMGHVDHGKTSLLDAIRETNVQKGEEGGITQHIGAYQVEKNNRKITFLDTPGHEAFTAMRARGAHVTDIAVLVVAADDGVQPQTIEAINHAKAAGVPIIVAINKIDRPDADPMRVKAALAEHNVVVEALGGTVVSCEVSAKQKIGLETLLEMVLLVADMQDLKANPNRPAVGTIIEAKKTPTKGAVATVLVQAGTLNVRDCVLAGMVSGKIKAMVNDQGDKVVSVPPGTPVEFYGLDNVPEAGDILQVVACERDSQQLANVLQKKDRARKLRPKSTVSLETFYQLVATGEQKKLNIILKADVQGSLEAIKDSLKKLETQEVGVDFIHTGTGDISPSDVTLALASNAVVLGFSVKIGAAAEQLLRSINVDVRLYRIIYKLIEDVQKAMGGLLEPEDIEIIKARLEIKGVFSHKRKEWTIGGFLKDGILELKQKVKIFHGDQIAAEGDIVTLKREADNVKQVKDGVECGIGLDNVRGTIKVGDELRVIIIEKKERSL
jgi:translation initiation factor IF-2